jgi:two-component system LytT family sensor kinase
VNCTTTRMGILLGGWSILALVLAVNRSIYKITIGQPPVFGRTLWEILQDYWIWVFLTPVVFWLARRFPFTRRDWPRSVIVHFCGYLVLTFLHEIAAVALHLPTWVPSTYHGSLLKLRIAASLNEDLWMYWPIVVTWSLFEYYQRYRERDLRAAQLSEKLARAELQALRNQLHPHFLFNTLNSIAAFIHENVEAADDMLADLAYLLRAYLAGNEEQEITLSREVELLNTYVRIQQRRFEDRLFWSVEIPDEIKEALVPSLLLQPLVENSILHGIAPRSGPGRVSLVASGEGSSLHLNVIDDGVGLEEGSSEGVGLSNTRARLKQLYGSEHSLRVCDAPGQGVVVQIVLPLRFGDAGSRGEQHEHSNGYRGRRAARTKADFIAPVSRS